MSEITIYIGAILSAASIGVGGVVIAAMIMGYRIEYFNIILPIISVLIVIGVIVILYGTSKFEEEKSE